MSGNSKDVFIEKRRLAGELLRDLRTKTGYDINVDVRTERRLRKVYVSQIWDDINALYQEAGSRKCL